MIEIEMEKVQLSYGHKVVLNDITLKVLPGEIVGLIGPNGCGKSTIIRALSRVIPSQRGRILLDGRDIAGIPRRDLARLLGVVPQMPLLPSTFTAFEIVLMGRNPHLGFLQHEGPRELAIVWQAMKMTATHTLARRRINELSGGEIQCLLIARVLAQETRAVLLDEPTANLDIGRQIGMLDLVRGLCSASKLTALLALHDLNLSAQYCNRLFLLHNGRVYAQGTPGEVITARNIREVYGVEGCVYSHPLNSLPAVLVNAGDDSRARRDDKVPRSDT
ncbi:MAG: ABC transporter ATP-binding protein [Chloroflexota bacterium]